MERTMRKQKNGSYEEGYLKGYEHFKKGLKFSGGTITNMYTVGFVEGYYDARMGNENKFLKEK
jgi:hypothetical protein